MWFTPPDKQAKTAKIIANHEAGKDVEPRSRKPNHPRGGEKIGRRVIATPCPLCRQNVEMYQDAVNKKYGTDCQIPVVFHSQLMAVAFGIDAKKDACLDRNTIRSEKLEKMARKG